jgi:hypothetical protein
MKIVIEVKGGVVQAIRSTSEYIQIVILDYDNDKISGDHYEPDNIFTEKGIDDYIQKEIEAHNIVP